MKLLCHRGMWTSLEEQNTFDALIRAIDRGLGVETDIRDCNGSLVISHDPPIKEGILSLERFLEAYASMNRKPLLALNVKADGLQERLDKMLRAFNVGNYFVFDMSLPDALSYLKRGMPLAARLSEYEDGKRLLEIAEIIWLDAFESEWYSIGDVSALLESGKRVCIVSPELHHRPHTKLWSDLARVTTDLAERLYLCTDLFDEAQEVFNVVKD